MWHSWCGFQEMITNWFGFCAHNLCLFASRWILNEYNFSSTVMHFWLKILILILSCFACYVITKTCAKWAYCATVRVSNWTILMWYCFTQVISSTWQKPYSTFTILSSAQFSSWAPSQPCAVTFAYFKFPGAVKLLFLVLNSPTDLQKLANWVLCRDL